MMDSCLGVRDRFSAGSSREAKVLNPKPCTLNFNHFKRTVPERGGPFFYSMRELVDSVFRIKPFIDVCGRNDGCRDDNDRFSFAAIVDDDGCLDGIDDHGRAVQR